MFSSASRRSALSFASGGGIDAVALGWRQRVVSAGGTVSGKTLSAVSRFVRSAKGAGYWSKLQRLNLFCGDQLAAALVPQAVGAGSATETNISFVAGDYTEATGLTGDGVAKYLNTGLASNALTLNDTHLAVYNRSSASGGTHMGVVNVFEMFSPHVDGTVYSDQYGLTTGRAHSGAIGTPFGFVVGSRVSAVSHAVYRNGSSIVSNATSEGALSASVVFVFAANGSGTPSGFTSNVLAGYSVGSGLSAADVTSYNSHMQAFQTALGRNV